MRRFRFRFGAPIVAAVLVAVWLGAGMVSAQGSTVRINGAIDKLAKGKSLAGAIMYDFSLYAAAQFSSSDLDFIIIDMEHRGLDFERLETFLLGTTNKAEIAKQGNLQVRVPPIVRIPTYGRAPNEAIVKQVLDMGAFGIMFPAIENKQQALEAVSASRYPQLKGSKYPQPRRPSRQRQHACGLVLGIERPEYWTRADVWPANPDGEIAAVPAGRNGRGREKHQGDPVGAGHRRGVRRAERSVVVARRAAGLPRARTRRCRRCLSAAMSEKHSGRYHGDRSRRRQQAEAGIPHCVAAERWSRSTDGRDVEARADGDPAMI